MRIEKKREQELAQRKGLTRRTIIQAIWLIISAIIVYFVLNLLFENGVVNYNLFYTRLLIPRTVPEGAIFAALLFVGVFVMQFFLLLGYAFASPQGRTRPGNPSLYSRNPDPLEREYRR